MTDHHAVSRKLNFDHASNKKIYYLSYLSTLSILLPLRTLELSSCSSSSMCFEFIGNDGENKRSMNNIWDGSDCSQWTIFFPSEWLSIEIEMNFVSILWKSEWKFNCHWTFGHFDHLNEFSDCPVNEMKSLCADDILDF